MGLLNNSSFIDFSLIRKMFLDDNGNLIGERIIDYTSLISLLRDLKVTIVEKYSKNYLAAFWQGDEADRCVAEGIVDDSIANDKAIKELKKINTGMN